MDEDRIAGMAKELKGKLKQTVGALVGDAKLQVDGAADQAAGKIQNAVGSARDALKK